MTERAWVVSYDHDAYSVVIYATTRNKARALGAGELEREYMEVTVRCAKEWDDKPPTLANLLAAGWTYECRGCYRRLDEETATIVETWEVYCDADCKTKAVERDARIEGFNAGAAFRIHESIYDDAQGALSRFARRVAVANP